MKTKQKIKIAVDLLMTIALLLLMPYEMIGEAAHEWIGAGMFLVIIIHHNSFISFNLYITMLLRF